MLLQCTVWYLIIRRLTFSQLHSSNVKNVFLNKDFLVWHTCSRVSQMVHTFAANLWYTRPTARVLQSWWVLVLHGWSVHAWESFGLQFWMTISLAVVSALAALPEVLEQYPESLNSAQVKFPGGKKKASPWQHPHNLTLDLLAPGKSVHTFTHN